MQIIKHKAKRKDNKEWVEGFLFFKIYEFVIQQFEPISPSFQDPAGNPDNYEIYKIIPETICQFTTQQDKNKKDLYQNDICKYKDDSGTERIGIIKWCDYKWILEAIDGDDEGNQDIDLHPDYEIEKIGNIHDKGD